MSDYFPRVLEEENCFPMVRGLSRARGEKEREKKKERGRKQERKRRELVAAAFLTDRRRPCGLLDIGSRIGGRHKPASSPNVHAHRPESDFLTARRRPSAAISQWRGRAASNI